MRHHLNAKFLFLALVEFPRGLDYLITYTIFSQRLELLWCDLQIDKELRPQFILHGFNFAIAIILVDKLMGKFINQIDNVFLDSFADQSAASPCVDHLALLVHHVVVFKQSLANPEVILLDFLLRPFDRSRDERMRDHFAFFQSQPFHDACNAVAAKQAHQIVFQREEEHRRSRITLTTCASAQLPVNAPGFMALRANNVQPSRITHTRTKLDVRTAACHVRRNRDRTRVPRV